MNVKWGDTPDQAALNRAALHYINDQRAPLPRYDWAEAITRAVIVIVLIAAAYAAVTGH